VAPDFTTCRCNEELGYAGGYCHLPQCIGANFPSGCNNGVCASPNKCECDLGWNGTDCSIPMCDPPCQHGECAGPDSCDCSGSGYQHCTNAPPVCGCDENECLRAYKVCDELSSCMNFVGGYNCSGCPVGYPGEPYLYYPNAPQSYDIVHGGCSVAITRKTSQLAQTQAQSTLTDGAQDTAMQTTADINLNNNASGFAPLFFVSLAICRLLSS
jgi:hypothetical protein